MEPCPEASNNENVNKMDVENPVPSKQVIPNRFWQHGKSLGESIIYLLDHQIECDVTFLVYSSDGSSSRVSAHKLILGSRSPVFEAMLESGKFAESKQEEIEIHDTEIYAFKEMLSYMYSDDVVLTEDNVMFLLFLAHKYLLEGLMTKCSGFLDDIIKDDTVCSILNQILSYKDQIMISKCLNYIAVNFLAVSEYKCFMDLSSEALKLILDHSDLSVNTELDVFHVVVEWSKHKLALINTESGVEFSQIGNKIRDALGETLFQIRFFSMTNAEFTENVEATGILNSEEIKLFSVCTLGLSSTEEICQLRSLGFNMDQRTTVKQDLIRFSMISTTHRYKMQDEVERFYVIFKKSVQFGGVYCLKGQPGARHTITVRVIELPERIEICSYTRSITSPANSAITHIPVYTKKCIHFKRFKKYKICASLSGEDTHYGSWGDTERTQFVINNVGINVENKQNNFRNNHGRFSGLLFFPIDRSV